MRRHMRGVAAVEFAILAIPLVTLAFGITELGRAMYSYNTLVKAVRDAARYLTTRSPGNSADHETAKCLVVFGLSDCADTVQKPLAPGLTKSMVRTCDAVLTCDGVESVLLTGSGTIRTVTVSISGYPYNSLVEFVVPDMTFGDISVTMRAPQ